MILFWFPGGGKPQPTPPSVQPTPSTSSNIPDKPLIDLGIPAPGASSNQPAVQPPKPQPRTQTRPPEVPARPPGVPVKPPGVPAKPPGVPEKPQGVAVKTPEVPVKAQVSSSGDDISETVKGLALKRDQYKIAARNSNRDGDKETAKTFLLISKVFVWHFISPLVELMKLSCKLSLVNSHATLVLAFDQDMRVDETLLQTLACQLSCNSCSRLTKTWELMKLSCKLSLVNSHATLVLVWPGHESWWNSHANSRLSTLMQLLFSHLTRTRELMKLSCKLSLVNSHATLVLVWPGHESWWNSLANSRLSTLMQTLAY